MLEVTTHQNATPRFITPRVEQPRGTSPLQTAKDIIDKFHCGGIDLTRSDLDLLHSDRWYMKSYFDDPTDSRFGLPRYFDMDYTKKEYIMKNRIYEALVLKTDPTSGEVTTILKVVPPFVASCVRVAQDTVLVEYTREHTEVTGEELATIVVRVREFCGAV